MGLGRTVPTSELGLGCVQGGGIVLAAGRRAMVGKESHQSGEMGPGEGNQ